MESLKGDGAANDIAAEGFESLGIGGVEEDIIVDAKAAARVFRGQEKEDVPLKGEAFFAEPLFRSFHVTR